MPARGFETNLVWFFPLFFDFPAERAGEAESGVARCHKLVIILPLGTRAEYFIDARTSLASRIAVEEKLRERAIRMEREWLDLKPVEGILFPTRTTYPGRGGKRATAEIRSLEINPVLGDDRFKAPDPGVPPAPGLLALRRGRSLALGFREMAVNVRRLGLEDPLRIMDELDVSFANALPSSTS